MTVSHVAFDQYNVHSTKGQTRDRRSGGSCSSIHHIQIDATTLTTGHYFWIYQRIRNIYATYAANNCGAKLGDGHVLFNSVELSFQTSIITSQSSQWMPTLQSNQEEADTHIIPQYVESCDYLHHRSSIPARDLLPRKQLKQAYQSTTVYFC